MINLLLPLLTGGGAQLGGVAALVAFFSTLTACLIAFRRKIPHPSEFALIGRFYRFMKWHTHDAFDLIVDIHTVQPVMYRTECFIEVRSGRFREKTQTERVETPHNVLGVYQRINIHVRQKEKNLKLLLMRSQSMRAKKIGETTVSVENVILAYNFPRNQTLDVLDNGRRVATMEVSFYRNAVDPYLLEQTGIASPEILQQLIINSEVEGQPLKMEDIALLNPIDRIILVSKVLNGELDMFVVNEGYQQYTRYYFKATYTRAGVFVWCYWYRQADMEARNSPVGMLVFSSIAAVLQSKDSRLKNEFFVRYRTRGQVKEFHMRRVDRAASIWVNGLYTVTDLIYELGKQKRASLSPSDASRMLAESKLFLSTPTAVSGALNAPESPAGASGELPPEPVAVPAAAKPSFEEVEFEEEQTTSLLPPRASASGSRSNSIFTQATSGFEPEPLGDLRPAVLASGSSSGSLIAARSPTSRAGGESAVVNVFEDDE